MLIHNLNGEDRRLANKEKSAKNALRPITKPRQLYLRRETSAKLDEIKANYSEYSIPRNALITEYLDYIKMFDKIKKGNKEV